MRCTFRTYWAKRSMSCHAQNRPICQLAGFVGSPRPWGPTVPPSPMCRSVAANLRKHDVSRVGAHRAFPKGSIRSPVTVSTSDGAMAGTDEERPRPTGPGLSMVRQLHGPGSPSWDPPWNPGSVSCSRWSSRSSSRRSRSRLAAWRSRIGSSRARPAARRGPAARPPPERPAPQERPGPSGRSRPPPW